jgi:hypothetical protein
LLIAGNCQPLIKGQTFNMHAQELVVTHALGLRKCSKNKIVTVSFELGVILKEKFKLLVSKLMNKNKNLFSIIVPIIVNMY